MVKNMGSADKTARLVIGILLIVIGLLPMVGAAIVGGPWNWLLAVIGLVLVVTAAMNYCPAYTLIGVNTDKDKK